MYPVKKIECKNDYSKETLNLELNKLTDWQTNRQTAGHINDVSGI